MIELVCTYFIYCTIVLTVLIFFLHLNEAYVKKIKLRRNYKTSAIFLSIMICVCVNPLLALDIINDEHNDWIESYSKQKNELELVYSYNSSTVMDKSNAYQKSIQLQGELTYMINIYNSHPFLFEDDTILSVEPIELDDN